MTSDNTLKDLKEILSEMIEMCDNEGQEYMWQEAQPKLLALIKSAQQEARKEGYNPNRLGSWIFIGDNARLKNLDDLYWSYVIEFMAENDPWSASHDKGFVERQKRNMKYASFGGVGETKALARADQRAKERLTQIESESKNG